MFFRIAPKPAATLLAAAFAFSMLTFAQSDNASISGVIRDPGAALVPKATIVLTDERTGLERRAVTNESGYYVFTSIPPGFYNISAESRGFKKTQQTTIKLFRQWLPTSILIWKSAYSRKPYP